MHIKRTALHGLKGKTFVVKASTPMTVEKLPTLI